MLSRPISWCAFHTGDTFPSSYWCRALVFITSRMSDTAAVALERSMPLPVFSLAQQAQQRRRQRERHNTASERTDNQSNRPSVSSRAQGQRIRRAREAADRDRAQRVVATTTNRISSRSASAPTTPLTVTRTPSREVSPIRLPEETGRVSIFAPSLAFVGSSSLSIFLDYYPFSTYARFNAKSATCASYSGLSSLHFRFLSPFLNYFRFAGRET
jgi:hypothetical protein